MKKVVSALICVFVLSVMAMAYAPDAQAANVQITTTIKKLENSGGVYTVTFDYNSVEYVRAIQPDKQNEYLAIILTAMSSGMNVSLYFEDAGANLWLWNLGIASQ